MPWFKVDDKLHDHRKVRRAGVAAMGLWALAGAWCADNVLSNVADGFVPDEVLPRWSSRDCDVFQLADRLVTAEFWIRVELGGEGGYQFNGWAEFQPTKAEVLAERRKAADRQKAWREKRNGVTDGVSNSAPTRPDPTRPDRSGSSVGTSGESSVTRAVLSPFCKNHPDGTPDPCAGCARARTSYDRQQQAAQSDAAAAKTAAASARSEEIRKCAHCDDNGIAVDIEDRAYRCTHPKG